MLANYEEFNADSWANLSEQIISTYMNWLLRWASEKKREICSINTETWEPQNYAEQNDLDRCGSLWTRFIDT